MAIPQQTSVLIVGAGPSGLMMAAQLLRYGVQPIIIDQRDGPTDHTKALAVQARTMEIYRQMGLVDRVLSEGKPSEGITFNQNGKPQASFDFENIGTGQTPFPYVFFYPQSRNERLLLDELTRLCCPVYWNTTLVSVKQHSQNVTAVVNDGNAEQITTCNWVIGADGAHSKVRKQLNIKFVGDTYPHSFYLIDAQLAPGQLKSNIELHLAKKGLAAFFPMPDKDTYRILGDLPASLENKENVTVEDVLPYLRKVTNWPVELAKTNWFSLYRIHHRVAENFRLGNCFLIGDAAHIHSPVGGQGMNTGLQDAYNLAWKLAGVINGQLNTQMLDSYAAERMPVAKALVHTTDRAFNIITTGNFIINFAKRWVVPGVLKLVWGSQKFKELFFRQVSQTSISYRHSKINLHLSRSSAIKAGDRLPYIKIYDEKTQQETDLHAWCSKPGFTLIVLGKYKEIDIFTLAKWITQKYNGILNLYYLPPSTQNTAVFTAFDISNLDQKKAIIVRPDMYIGFINDIVAIDMMDNYLLNVAGVLAQANQP
ncbi:monooxygenase [Mucilaginibacter limnophilus]|uniref:Monooxygenase n=1 Tax=Mucilaginibacter limnophilus TaxID=1932778 RepID=A0A3S3TIE8_9SPHI|nr:FAD-dependent monooxygenase [Mucilaginibacter limnophilus]RVU01776.1 monooxygenase [Mucilaginibacter limnophilus]